MVHVHLRFIFTGLPCYHVLQARINFEKGMMKGWQRAEHCLSVLAIHQKRCGEHEVSPGIPTSPYKPFQPKHVKQQVHT